MVIVLKIPTRANFANVHTKAVSKVLFDTLSPFIACRIENLWCYYSHFYSNDIIMNYTISLILDVVYCETSERYCSDLDDTSQVSFCVFFEHKGSVNFELGIVQVKQRFLRGNTRKGAR